MVVGGAESEEPTRRKPSRLPPGCKIAIVTFDRSIQFYDFSGGREIAEMLEVGDIDDVFLPLSPDAFFVDPADARWVSSFSLEVCSSLTYILKPAANPSTPSSARSRTCLPTRPTATLSSDRRCRPRCSRSLALAVKSTSFRQRFPPLAPERSSQGTRPSLSGQTGRRRSLCRRTSGGATSPRIASMQAWESTCYFSRCNTSMLQRSVSPGPGQPSASATLLTPFIHRHPSRRHWWRPLLYAQVRPRPDRWPAPRRTRTGRPPRDGYQCHNDHPLFDRFVLPLSSPR